MSELELDPALVEDPYPFQRHMGFKLVAWKEGYSRFELPWDDYLGNRYGILHGGIHGVLCDTVMGFAGCYTGDPERKQLAMTLSLNVNFIGQLQGKVIIAEGFRTGGGRKTFFAEAKVRDDLGNLLATGSGAFRMRG
ncbi:PaaI family thioesterase [Pseudooceanicola sp. 502str34]